MSEREVLQSLIPYVPPYWVRQAFADPSRTLAGLEDRSYGAVLFVDISGFTPMSEALSHKGRDGIDELSRILERYFTVMSELVLAHGGEVVKFAGDSLITVFPAAAELGEAHLGAALRCSLEMQKAMAQFAEVGTSAGTFPLRMKIGIGEGRLYHTTVGDESKGMQPVFAGLPLARCIEAESNASAGEIVADAALLSRTPGQLDIGEVRGTFRLIESGTDVPALPPTRNLDVSALSPQQVRLALGRLVPYLPAQLVERIQQGRRGVFCEYRRVTVAFVKFGGLNYDWDPDVGTVLQIYFRAMRDCIARHGGRLNEVDIVSDGGTLVVLFGAPTAYEDHAMRAVACAWEMQQTVADVRLEAGEPAERLRQQIGISSGPVFVGDVGAPVRRTYTAVGDEVNLSSRLMELAHRGEVLVTGNVQRRAAGRYEFETMGETQVRGKSDLVSIHVLVGPRQEGARHGLASELMDQGPLRGREQEVSQLSEAIEQALRGHSHLIRITGEAGLGKSRLVGELMQRWIRRGGRAYAGDCERQGNGDAYRPWRALLRTVFGLRDADSMARQREKVETLLTLMSPSLASRASLFGDLLGVDIVRDPFSPLLSSEDEQAELQDVIRDFVRTISQRQPLLLVFENVHEIDDASLALLGSLLDNLRGFPLLACAAYRPRAGLGLGEVAIGQTHLELGELSERDSLALAQGLLGDVGLSLDLAPQVVNQTQGNPFYVQEMVNALANAVSEGDVDASEVLVRGGAVPGGISDRVQAQIDQLGEDVKLTLRIAAVIGHKFSLSVLRQAHPLPVSEQELLGRLAVLEQMRVLSREKVAGGTELRFQHRMTRQVIYAGMLGADRERLHRHAAAAIESVHVDDLGPRYEQLAVHHRLGNAWSRAATYYILAGYEAQERREDQGALAFYDLAERALAECGDCSQRCRDGSMLFLSLRRAEVNYALADIPRAIEDRRRACEIASRLVDLDSMGEALLGLGDIAFHQARYVDAGVLVRRAMQPFASSGNSGAVSRSLLLAARIEASQGRLVDAARRIDEVLALDETAQDPELLAACRCWQGLAAVPTGRYRQAMEALQRAVQLGRRADSVEVVGLGLLGLAQVFLYRGRWTQALDSAREALQIAESAGASLAMADARRILALLLSRVGSYDAAHEAIIQSLSALARAEWRVELASAYWVAGNVCLAQGRYGEGQQRFDNAYALGRESNTVEAVVYAQLGLSQLAAARSDWANAHRLCTEARARARRAGLELAVVTARLVLARIHLARGEFRRAQYEAMQALDASARLRCPYEVFWASATLGEALSSLAQPLRAEQYVADARSAVAQIVSSLPDDLQECFVSQPHVRAVWHQEQLAPASEAA